MKVDCDFDSVKHSNINFQTCAKSPRYHTYITCYVKLLKYRNTCVSILYVGGGCHLEVALNDWWVFEFGGREGVGSSSSNFERCNV